MEIVKSYVVIADGKAAFMYYTKDSKYYLYSEKSFLQGYFWVMEELPKEKALQLIK